ncbi:MAG: sigma-54-dependent Fis family transcriptional regulator [Bacteroidales bacterium]|nr:sigma-54-dependent Fis family transcriptional regulator [Bacteroidales bacterium]
MNIQQIKLRYGIIGNSPALDHALEIALQVAQTDLSVLITGESGVGKEIFSQVVHSNSARKHNPYIAVNCGAIPQGTIDSELFGHEKGSFTGAHEQRKGYFEVVNKGTIFLDEVAELPLGTQVRLLRILETGEFIKVGSSKVLKTDVRVIAATNVNFAEAAKKGDFREDLYYRLSTVPIHIPPLRERGEDIFLLFTKFATDFADKYQMPPLRLLPEAKQALLSYNWPGNVRQLKNVTEQISIIEQNRTIDLNSLKKYLKGLEINKLPAIYKPEQNTDFSNEREILFKFLFDIKKDVEETKKMVSSIIQGADIKTIKRPEALTNYEYKDEPETLIKTPYEIKTNDASNDIEFSKHIEDTEEIIEENLSLSEMEKNLIIKALTKNKGKRKIAADDLGISERTLYRKIKEYDIEL